MDYLEYVAKHFDVTIVQSIYADKRRVYAWVYGKADCALLVQDKSVKMDHYPFILKLANCEAIAPRANNLPALGPNITSREVAAIAQALVGQMPTRQLKKITRQTMKRLLLGVLRGRPNDLSRSCFALDVLSRVRLHLIEREVAHPEDEEVPVVIDDPDPVFRIPAIHRRIYVLYEQHDFRSRFQDNDQPEEQNLVEPEEQNLVEPEEQNLVDPEEQNLVEPEEVNLVDPEEVNLVDPEEQNLMAFAHALSHRSGRWSDIRRRTRQKDLKLNQNFIASFVGVISAQSAMWKTMSRISTVEKNEE